MTVQIERYFLRLQTTLLKLGREERSVDLGEKLDEYEELVQMWLRLATPKMSSSRMFALKEWGRGGLGPLEVDLYKVVHAASEPEDRNTYDAVLRALGSLLFRAKHTQHSTLCGEYGRILEWAFGSGIRREGIAKSTWDWFDTYLHTLLSSLKCLHSGLERMSPEELESAYERDRVFLDIAVRLTINVTKLSLDVGFERAARQSFGRLIEHRRHRMSERGRLRAPDVETPETLVSYAVIVVNAWALRVLEEDQGNSEARSAAVEVIGLVAQALPPRHELIALWELYRNGEPFEPEVDRRLGVLTWSRYEGSFRAGVSEARTVSYDWIDRGFYLAMLLAPPAHRWQVENYFLAVPSRSMWNADSARSVLEQLSRSEYSDVRDTSDIDRVEECFKLIESRQWAADAAYLERVLSEPLDVALVERLRRDSLKALREHRNLVSFLHQFVKSAAKLPFIPDSVTQGTYVPRDYLLPQNNWASGFGEFVGRRAAEVEAVNLLRLAEKSATQRSVLEALEDVGAEVMSACERLRAQGQEASVVFLPSQHRFASSLFGSPAWQIEADDELRGIGYGTWRGLPIVKYPYADPSSIIVADASTFFGGVSSPVGPRVEVIDSDQDERLAHLERALEGEGGELPEPSKSVVIAQIVSPPILGIRNPDGCVAIDVTRSDGAYQMIPGGDLYHRPSCEVIEGAEGVQGSLAKHLLGDEGERDPCPDCRPERWDSEAWRG